VHRFRHIVVLVTRTNCTRAVLLWAPRLRAHRRSSELRARRDRWVALP